MDYTLEINPVILFGKEKLIAYFSFPNKKKKAFVTLDHFSKESFFEGLEQLKSILHESDSLEKIQTSEQFFPSVNFFIDNLKAQENDQSINSAILYFGLPKEKIYWDYQNSKRTFKIKIKKINQTFVEELHEIVQKCPEILLRLDFNRSLTNQDLKLIELLPMNHVDYLEEPTKNNLELIKKWPQKIALDETFRHFPNRINQDAVYIIKPLLTNNYRKQIEKLLQKNLRVIISSAFEMPCGINLLKNIIFDYKLDSETHGLDTYKYYGLPGI